MLTVLRREEKYALTLSEAHHYAAVFSKLLAPDSYSHDGSYVVRSLYFDTVDDKDFFDKITEQNLRRKIRIRIYSPDAKTAKLEMKQKENIFQRKRSLVIPREEAQALIDGDFAVLLRHPEPFAAELFALMNLECYRPKSIVEYDRRAFMAKENNIRLTFDSKIRATESCYDLFSDNLPLYPVSDGNRVTFEVKYDKFMLGYISDIVSSVDRTRITSSKYCLSRSIGYPHY